MSFEQLFHVIEVANMEVCRFIHKFLFISMEPVTYFIPGIDKLCCVCCSVCVCVGVIRAGGKSESQ